MKILKFLFVFTISLMILSACSKEATVNSGPIKEDDSIIENIEYSSKYFLENYEQMREITDIQLKEILVSPLNDKLKSIWNNNNFCEVSEYQTESKFLPPEGSQLPVISKADDIYVFYQGADYDLGIEVETEFGELGVWKIQTSANIVDGDAVLYENILFSPLNQDEEKTTPANTYYFENNLYPEVDIFNEEIQKTLQKMKDHYFLVRGSSNSINYYNFKTEEVDIATFGYNWLTDMDYSAFENDIYSFMTPNCFNEMGLNKSFMSADGKLALVAGDMGWMFQKRDEKDEYIITELNDSNISFIRKETLYMPDSDEPEYYITDISLVKDNGQWKVDNYKSDFEI